MKKYTEFVQRTYAAIAELYEYNDSNRYAIFAEGEEKQFYSQNQEYAILRNDYAKVFTTVIKNHADLLEISETEYHAEPSKLYPTEIKIAHSCYPKNIRRWLSGTISRKKKCRIEFCVLVWCHAIGWNLAENESEYQSEKLQKCRQKLHTICMEYLPEDVKNDTISFELLWKTSTLAYFNSFIR